ncbi:ABC transporter permease subunit [candidate division KSB1 bacterium]
MIWEIFKKEFRDQLNTFRFLFGLGFCLIVFPLFAAVIGGNLNLRQENYLTRVQESEKKLSNIMVYGNVNPQVYRQPSKLSIICRGVEEQLPADAQILLQGIIIPMGSEASSNRGHVESRYQLLELSDQAKEYFEENRPNYAMNVFGAAPLKSGLGLIGVFPGFDISFLVIFVFSLLALIFGYNNVSGERESATIKLVLAGRCSRFQFVLGKALAGFVSLTALIFISLVSALLTFMLLFNISFNSTEWMLLVLLFVGTVLFAFVFLNIGLLFSSLIRHSSTSLIAGLVTWVFLVVCSPVLVGGIVNKYVSLPDDQRLNEYSAEILADAGERVSEINEEIQSQIPPQPSNWANIQSDADSPLGGWYHWFLTRYRALKYMTTFPYTEPVWVDAGNRMVQVMDDYYRDLDAQSRYFALFSGFNPVQAYKNLSMRLCGTDASAFFNFYDQAKSYRRVILTYLTDRNAFAQLRYIVGTDLSIDQLPDTRENYMRMMKERYDYEARRPKNPPPPIPDIPRFQYKIPGITDKVTATYKGFGFLAIINLLLIMASIVIVSKSSLN